MISVLVLLSCKTCSAIHLLISQTQSETAAVCSSSHTSVETNHMLVKWINDQVNSKQTKLLSESLHIY